MLAPYSRFLRDEVAVVSLEEIRREMSDYDSTEADEEKKKEDKSMTKVGTCLQTHSCVSIKTHKIRVTHM